MFSFPDLSRVLGVSVEFPDNTVPVTGVSIDTRSLEEGHLFIALPGCHADGHVFLEEAFRRKASGAVVSRKYLSEHPQPLSGFRNLIAVEDPAEALARIAAWYRSLFDLKVVGITGSVGKTTTKEFLSYLLSKKYSVLATRGNLNNHLGLPLTLLGLRPEHRVCVAELGANHIGEIRNLTKILQPTAVMITRICPVHVEGFGSLDAIYEAKTELFETLGPSSRVVLPDDDPKLLKIAEGRGLHVVTVGFSAGADFRITGVTQHNGFTHLVVNDKKCCFASSASFLASNAAMAIAMGDCLGLSLDEIPVVWDDMKFPPGRFEEHRLGDGIRVVFDGYNASPVSFEKAIESFCSLQNTGNRMLIFSDMLELGPEAARFHEELGEKISASSLNYVAAYGPLSRGAIETVRRLNPRLEAEYFRNASEAAHAVLARIKTGDGVLLKASRGMKIEEALGCLKERLVPCPR